MRLLCLTIALAASTSGAVDAEGLTEAARVILDDAEPRERREECQFAG